MANEKAIPPEDKITGSEPASTMTIYQHTMLHFMSALCVLPRQKPREVAQEAQRYTESYLEACNDEIYSPGDN